MYGLSTQAADVLALVAVIAATGALILGLEDLLSLRSFASSRLMSWETGRLHTPWTSTRWSGRALDRVLRYDRFRWIVVTRVVAAASVIIGGVQGELWSLPLAAVLVALVALSLRSPYGLDGAHQMYVVLFAALTIASLERSPGVATSSALIFIGAQGVLAYLVSGLSKLADSLWRSGDAMRDVMGTSSYGHKTVYRLLAQRPHLAFTACWTVMLFELAFLPATLLGGTTLAVAIIAGFLFHSATAVLMGLNGFVWAFVATYPAIIASSQLLHDALFGN